MREYRHKVQYYETDKMGITHHSNYVRWMEDARIDFLDQIGWSYAKIEAAEIISPVTDVECKYKMTTTFLDVITITVAVEEFKGVKLKLKYTMKNEEGKTVCQGRTGHCFIDKSGKVLQLNKAYPELYDCLCSLAERET